MKKLLLAALLVTSTARAEFLTGNDLHQKLNSVEPMDRIHGMGFVQGVFDVYVKITICPPANVTAGQVTDTIKGYLTYNANQRHFSAESLINQALKQAWPCKQQGNNNRL